MPSVDVSALCIHERGLQDMNDDAIHLRLWGKTNPYKPLYQHLLDAGCVAHELMAQMHAVRFKIALNLGCSEEEACQVVAFLCGMHDIGKAYPWFQLLAPDQSIVADIKQTFPYAFERNGSRYCHESGSCEVLTQYFKVNNVPPRTARLFSSVIRYHHYRQVPMDSDLVYQTEMGTFWQFQHTQIVSIVEKAFPVKWSSITSSNNRSALGILLWGMVILADWIASSDFMISSEEQCDNEDAYLHFARNAAAEAVKQCGLGSALAMKPEDKSFESLWGFSPRPLQRTTERIASEDSPLFTIIEAPMGEGKTEAALHYYTQIKEDLHADGLYVAMPTSATSNAMSERVTSMLEQVGLPSARLLHAMAWLVDEKSMLLSVPSSEDEDKENSERSFWLRPLRRGLLEQNAVGTVDQAMLSAMPIRFGVLRLLGLASKVLIIDEIHAYDTYMTNILMVLLGWCGALKVPVIALSATLPMERKKALVNAYLAGMGDIPATVERDLSSRYPLVTTLGQTGVLDEHSVEDAYMTQTVQIEAYPFLDSPDDVASLALKQVKDGGCLCVVCNTVVDAQRIYASIKGKCRDDVNMRDEEVHLRLFHARFTASRRQELEQECMNTFGKGGNRPKRAILVATQVVEQSLDLDFDMMISMIAPMDLLLQRMGRLHRHSTVKRPSHIREGKFTILLPNGDNYGRTGLVYQPWILSRTRSVLSSCSEIALPQSIRTLVESVYSAVPENSGDEEYELWFKLLNAQKFDQSAALVNSLPMPDGGYFFLTEGSTSGFLQEEDNPGESRIIQTRLGVGSVLVAFVEEEKAHKYQGLLNPNVKEAREILRQTVGVPAYDFGECAAKGFSHPIRGNGLLQHAYFLIPVQGEYVIEMEDRQVRLRLDHEYGLMVDRTIK